MPNQYQYKSFFFSYYGLIQAAKYNWEYNLSNKHFSNIHAPEIHLLLLKKLVVVQSSSSVSSKCDAHWSSGQFQSFMHLVLAASTKCRLGKYILQIETRKKSQNWLYIFNVRYLQNFLISNHVIICSLPFLYLCSALARFVSLHVHKEFM